MIDANSENRYFDRELSWLDFNQRVLTEGMDPANLVLERLKFIGIVSSNFDEFFMVRIPSIEPESPRLHAVRDKAFSIIRTQNEYFANTLVPELESALIRRVLPQQLTEKQIEYLRNLFYKEFLPVLTPIAVRQRQHIASIINLSLYRVFFLTNPKQPGSKHYAVIELPKIFPRMVSLPADEGYQFILLEDLISFFATKLFRGYEILGQGLIRITRAADLSLDEENDEDFSKIMSEALRARRQNHIVRLETDLSGELLDFIRQSLQLEEGSILPVEGWIDLKGISQLAFQPTFEHLQRPDWDPKPVVEFEQAEDLWKLIREKDVLIHHPYESFDSFIRFLSDAAQDPDVLAIKQTLYRTSPHSLVIAALEQAAENGKQVTVLLELKARFDEEKNIQWARRLENAGASILYGVAGLKTHAKICLVVRREPEGIRRYLHLGTGNYNEKTARIYSDLSLFTTDEKMTQDATVFFNVITGYSIPTGLSKLEIAPYGLRRRFEKLILRESLRSRKDQPGLIIAKMNSLVDPGIIEALYHASKSGVQIKLNVRGTCCLKPGIPGLSENIEVISVIDMFLEHSRIYYFYNGGDDELYLASADWMPRNLDRRLEVLFPVEKNPIKKELLETLKLYFKDNVKSWRLLASGEYQRIDSGNDKKFRVQEYLCKKTADSISHTKKSAPQELKPQKPKSDSLHLIQRIKTQESESPSHLKIVPPN